MEEESKQERVSEDPRVGCYYCNSHDHLSGTQSLIHDKCIYFSKPYSIQIELHKLSLVRSQSEFLYELGL